MNARNTGPSIPATRRRDKGRPEFLRILPPDSSRCKDPRLITAAWMQCIQAVQLQLPNIQDGPLAVRQLHEPPIVTQTGRQRADR